MPLGYHEPDRSPVHIVGVGAVSGYGWGRKQLLQGLLSGVSAVRAVARPGAGLTERPRWAAPIPDDEPPAAEEALGRAVLHAVHEAMGDAHDRGWRGDHTVGVAHSLVPDGGGVAMLPVVAQVAHQLGLHGPVVGVDAMAASAVAALLTAKSWIGGGLADDVLVVTGDMASAERYGALEEAGLLSQDPALDGCRPFQQGSTGFPPGDAVVAFVLSGSPRGAYASVLGGSLLYDDFHDQSPGPEPDAVRRAYDDAVQRAGIDPAEVRYVNAHGSGVPDADATEAGVIDALFPGAAGLFSVKPLVGHCQAAAGAVELCASLYGFETGVIPAPPRRSSGHPRLLDGPTAALDGLVAKASLDTSGHCGVLVLGRPAA